MQHSTGINKSNKGKYNRGWSSMAKVRPERDSKLQKPQVSFLFFSFLKAHLLPVQILYVQMSIKLGVYN